MKLTVADYKKIIAAKGSKRAVEVAEKFEVTAARVYELWRGELPVALKNAKKAKVK